MRRLAAIAATGILAAVLFVWATAGPPRPVPNPPGSFAFAALGDAPYFPWEGRQYRLVMREMDAHDLSFVVHVGDIFWHPCDDANYAKALARMNRMRRPVYYTPGDNEWTDCWEPGSGSFAPLERLGRLREVFFTDPPTSLGASRLPVTSQSASTEFPELRENRRWEHAGILFATVHLVGSQNGSDPFPGRTDADDAAVRRRAEGAAAWLRETFAVARSSSASAVVVAFHADPVFEQPIDDTYHPAYEPFMTALEEEVEAWGRPVLAIHGDEHTYRVDHPLLRHTTGRFLTNFTRVEVPGSPRVGWVRVVVAPGASEPFSFEEHVVPRWKYW